MSECVVCLESRDSVYNINDIACIKKTCKCEYFCHIECVKDWIYNNPSCLLCGTLMYVDDSVDLTYRYIHPAEDEIKVQMMPIVPYPAQQQPSAQEQQQPSAQEQQQPSSSMQNLSNIDNEIEDSVNEQLHVIQDDCTMKLCCQYIACVGSLFFIIIISSNFFQ